MNELRSFHGKQEIKEKYLDRLKAHALADEIIKGINWENGKGCAVGCTIHGGEHESYETELGLPEWLAHLEDGLFEGMSNEKAKEFPLTFLEAIPVGSDLTNLDVHFNLYLMEENLLLLKSHRGVDEGVILDVINAVEGVKNYFLCVLDGTSTVEMRLSAAESAWSAALSAWSAARSAAWSATYDSFADKLLELLRQAPVPKGK